MADFNDLISEWIENVDVAINETLQTIAYKVGESVIRLSPVDTGLFRGNWHMTIDTPSSAVLTREDKEGFQVLNELGQRVNGFNAGQIAYIQNNIEYGNDLEYGSSAQARNPDGMVRVTAMRFARIVNEAALLHKI